MDKHYYVIFSFEETNSLFSGEPLFWSDELGWDSLPNATIFTEAEKKRMDGHLTDGVFVLLPQIIEEED